MRRSVALLAITAVLCALALGPSLPAAFSATLPGPYPTMPTLTCSAAGWTVLGPAWRVPSVQAFAVSGGTLSPSMVAKARRLPYVEYWVLVQGTHLVDTCRWTSVTQMQLGVNPRNGTYLEAISVLSLAAAPPGSAAPPPLWAPPRAHCTSLKVTRYMGQVIYPRQFPVRLMDFARLRLNLGYLSPTSAWQQVRQRLYMTAFAGTSRAMRGHGEIDVGMSNPCTGQLGPWSGDTTAQRTGPLTLTGVRGNLISFVFSRGHGILDLRTHRFAFRSR